MIPCIPYQPMDAVALLMLLCTFFVVVMGFGFTLIGLGHLFYFYTGREADEWMIENMHLDQELLEHSRVNVTRVTEAKQYITAGLSFLVVGGIPVAFVDWLIWARVGRYIMVGL